MRFPSPIGELHFSIMNPSGTSKPLRFVSVPYRGATFLNVFLRCFISKNIVSVPYRGATFLNSDMIIVTTRDNFTFPSPIGELHFSMIKNESNVVIKTVSVPYRGATFLNAFKAECKKQGFKLFPSPIGELHFSIPSPQPHVLSGTNRGIAGEK